MSRLIDADRALETVYKQGIAHPNAYHLTNYAALILREAPTVDAIPIRHGQKMNEYIERERLLRRFNIDDMMNVNGTLISLEDARNTISNFPAADVAPIRHGRIIETIENGRMKRVFSCCGTDFTEMTCWMTANYCPNCGAKMESET